MINVSPVGRNASVQERNDYQKYDLQHNIRAKFIEALNENFPDYGLTYGCHSILTLSLSDLKI